MATATAETATREQVRYVTADDGTRIGYRVTGNGSRTLILQHGFHATGRNFDRLLPYLPPNEWTIIRMDIRGGGLSDKPAAGYTIERFARDLLAVMEEENVQNATLAAHSTGGAIAQWVASEPGNHRLRSMILLGPVPATGVPIPPGAANTFREGLDGYEQSATIWRMGLLHKPDRALLDELVADSATWDKNAYLQMFEAWTTGTNFPERLAHISVPTLVVGAAAEPFLKEPFLRAAVQEPIKGAQWASVPNASHFFHIEQPAYVAGLINGFDAAIA